MITFVQKGDFGSTKKYLKALERMDFADALDVYGAKGVAALQAATPKDTGETASHWGYQVIQKKNSIAIEWTNDYAPYGVPVAILIQYGHGTRNGGYVKGIDYINPALKPIFDEIAEGIWEEVTSS